jgi:hypothetical protein
VEATLDAMSSEFGLTNPPSTLEDVLQTDHMARKTARGLIEQRGAA